MLPDIDALMQVLEPLDLLVPDCLEASFGYWYPRRYLAAWWEWAGDKLVLWDGVICQDGCWRPYLTYLGYDPVFRRYDLGGSENPARQCLVFDLEIRRVYVGDIRPVRPALQRLAWLWRKESGQDGGASGRQTLTLAETLERERVGLEQMRRWVNEQAAQSIADVQFFS